MHDTPAAVFEQAVKKLVLGGYDRSEARATAGQLIDAMAGTHQTRILHPDTRFDSAQQVQIEAALQELVRGRPLRYITQSCEFFGHSFKCDERGLIPRPETETLVEAAIQRLMGFDSPLVADLGTGTGCIASAVLLSLPRARAVATDIESGALQLAAENADSLEVKSRLELVVGKAGEWAEPLLAAGFAGRFDAVLSNPPYIAHDEIANLQPQIRDHEPHRALDGGEGGLDCYRQLAAQCGCLLRAGGFLMMELGAGQFPDVEQIFGARDWCVQPPILDLAKTERVLVATLE